MYFDEFGEQYDEFCEWMAGEELEIEQYDYDLHTDGDNEDFPPIPDDDAGYADLD